MFRIIPAYFIHFEETAKKKGLKKYYETRSNNSFDKTNYSLRNLKYLFLPKNKHQEY